MSNLMDSAAGKGRNLSTNFWIWLLVGSLLASGVSRQFCPQPFYHLAAGRFRRQAIVDADRAARAGTTAP